MLDIGSAGKEENRMRISPCRAPALLA